MGTLTNAPSVLGVCDGLAVSGVPLTIRLGIFARFVGAGRALLGVRVLDPGGEVLHLFSAEAEFRGRPVNVPDWPTLTFATEGVYRV